MKRQLFIIALCIAMLSCVCAGCSDSNKDSSVSSKAGGQVASDSNNSGEKAGPNSVTSDKAFLSVATTIYKENENQVFNGNDITMKVNFEKYNSIKDLGFFVLCDGVRVPFSTNVDSEKKMMHTFNDMSSKIGVPIEFYIHPLGKNGTEPLISVMAFFNVNDNLNSIDFNKDENKYLTDFTGKVLCVVNSNIKMQKDSELCQDKISTVCERKPYSQEDKNKYIAQTGKNGEINNPLEYYQNELSVNGESESFMPYNMTKGQPLDVSLKLLGGKAANAYLSIYIDNELVSGFNGIKYSVVPVGDEKSTVLTAHIDTSNLSSGLHRVNYIIVYDNNKSQNDFMLCSYIDIK